MMTLVPHGKWYCIIVLWIHVLINIDLVPVFLQVSPTTPKFTIQDSEVADTYCECHKINVNILYFLTSCTIS